MSGGSMGDMEKYIKDGCECGEKYSIEPNQFNDDCTLFLGRCSHRHGYNLFTISDVAINADLDGLLKKLNT